MNRTPRIFASMVPDPSQHNSYPPDYLHDRQGWIRGVFDFARKHGFTRLALGPPNGNPQTGGEYQCGTFEDDGESADAFMEECKNFSAELYLGKWMPDGSVFDPQEKVTQVFGATVLKPYVLNGLDGIIIDGHALNLDEALDTSQSCAFMGLDYSAEGVAYWATDWLTSGMSFMGTIDDWKANYSDLKLDPATSDVHIRCDHTTSPDTVRLIRANGLVADLLLEGEPDPKALHEILKGGANG